MQDFSGEQLWGLEVLWPLQVFTRGTMVSVSFTLCVRYLEFQRMMYMGGYGDYGFNMGYADNYYNRFKHAQRFSGTSAVCVFSL